MKVTDQQARVLADVICETALLNTTLRDLFAAFALAGLMANQGGPSALGGSWLAAEAYIAADAMLAQRAQKES